MKRFLIIGGGAAGMLASVYAARNGMEVHLFEQNEKLGKKLFITGKGRCNFTNGCATEELFESFITNPRFLYSAVYGYTNYDVIDFFETAGVKTKMERGGRMFPLSDHSSDIIRALEQQMKKAGVKIHLGSRVKRLLVEKEEDGNARITGIQLDNGEKIQGEQVLVATGGNSYPSTGSTGDGYRMAKESGHTVTDLQPSLVPMVTAEEYIPRLQGLSLKNVTLSLYDGKKCVYEDFGEMMFTHFGITGPLVLSASAKVGKLLKKKYLTARIDLKPALTAEQLDARLLREFEEGKNKQFKNVAGSLFPAKLLPVMLDLGGIAPGKKVHEITREERAGFIEKTKAFPFTVTGLRGFQEAIITKGGVQVKEVDPKTMESKKTKGLYFAGEVLDLDALTGGYNLQIAWSTAHAAAMAAAEAAQLKRLQEEVVDIEDMTSGISIMDLGLNEFRLDLLEYMKQHEDIETAPKGLHTVVGQTEDSPAGVIFVLRNINDSVNIDNRNRIHPFYMVYISEEGEIVCDYLNPKKLLDTMRLLCRGKGEPCAELCRLFNDETDDGRKMGEISELLSEAINSIIDVKEENDIDSLFKSGGTSALLSAVSGLDDFELICFLVVK